MSDVPVQVMVAAFQDERGAKRALEALKQAKREKLIGIDDAVVLRKDENGKIHIKETADMGGGRGAAFGGVIGGAIGLIAGPALLVPVAVGALIGGLAAKLRDSGFDDERLEQIGQSLPPGTSAILAVVEHRWVEEVRKELAEGGADLVTEGLASEIADQLEAGNDVAFTALSTHGGFAADKDIWRAGDVDIERGVVIVGEDVADGVEFVATPKGFATREITRASD